MDRSRVGWVTASGPSGAFWSFALEKLVLEDWPWWAHAAAGTGLMLLALWWVSHRDRKMIPEALKEEGWLDRDGAEQAIRASSAFQGRLKDQAANEYALIEGSDPSYGGQVIAKAQMLRRREREVVMQMRREYTTHLPEGHLAKLDLYYEDTLRGWLIDHEPEPESESSAFDALSFLEEDP